uniref:Uncharacterized protein n=1 Tax=Graphocephala atropunctata TaxID=36148 RepID=A0A1B6K9W7_9HEMI
MTRAVGTRSSKRKPLKFSQDQEIIPDDCKQSSPSILSQSTTKQTVMKNKCAAAMKENIPDDCKQSSPSILSQSAAKRTMLKNKCAGAMKENISPKGEANKFLKSTPVINKDVFSPVRKSVRHHKYSPSLQDTLAKNTPERNVLCDKTNSWTTDGNKPDRKHVQVLQTVENKKNTLYKIINVPDPNGSGSAEKSSCGKENISSESHVPIYRNKELLEVESESKTLPTQKNEAVYEFEVDENEEPVQKKRRKKRVYIRKPKLGPKALTINNIKYSSTESLASLPEKPIAQKKRPTKGTKANLKLCPVVTLNDSEATCYSAKSFMSHPPSLILCENRNFQSKHELSVLQETQSEQCASPENVDSISDHLTETNCNSSIPLNISACSKENNPISTCSHFSPNPRCYVSKTSNKSNSSLIHNSNSGQAIANNTLPFQVSSCLANSSVTSTHVFLSSTPCKRTSLIVRNNSVFDDSCDLPRGMRPSTGFIKDVSASGNTSTDHCFGFDEPEELEEPLVSPIKSNIDLVPTRKPVKLFSWKTEPNQEERHKPSAQEVIEMLKATIPKTNNKQTSEVFDTSVQQRSSPSPTEELNEIPVNFRKPPRRSYERQRRIRHNSDHEEEEDESEKEHYDIEEEKEKVPKVVKKCYKKTANTTKTAKPRVTKSKQKAAKEEEELERLAAQMNAQFQKIEQMNLVVE